tara:strand:- start:97 stop:573 length:477 start_codon:yes stop_codon:yes gene_type:complete
MIGSDTYLNSGEIEDKLMAREWSIQDILNKDKICKEIARELISGMSIENMFWIVAETPIPYAKNGRPPMTFNKAIHHKALINLIDMVQFVLGRYLRTAKVEFNEDKINIEMLEEGPEGKLDSIEDNTNPNEKVMTLKDRIKNDTKLLNEEDKKKRGMI